MLVIPVSVLLILVFWWSGSVWIGHRSRSQIQRVWLSGVFGFAVLDLLATLLCFLKVLTPTGIAVSVIGYISATTVYFLLSNKRLSEAGASHRTSDFQGGGSIEQVPGDTSPWFRNSVVLVCIVVGVHTFLCALTPEVRSDPIRYHISLANQYAVRGGIEALRETVWWSIPQYAECLYALGIAIWNDTLAKVFHWWAGCLSALGVYALGERWFGRKAALWALLLWVTTPKVSYEATTTYVDLVLVVWVEVSVWYAMNAFSVPERKGAIRNLTASGLAMGMAFGTKYTTLGVQGLPWLVFPILRFRHDRERPKFGKWRYLIPFLGIGIADSPWVIRNSLLTGNPVYPLYNRLLGLRSEYDRGAELFFMTVWPGRSLLQPEFYFRRFEGLLLSGYVFPFIAVLCVLILVIVKQESRIKSFAEPSRIALLVFCFLSLVAYLVLTGNMDGRFWLPTLAVFLPFLGCGLCLFEKIGFPETGLVSQNRIQSLFVVAIITFCVYNYVGQRIVFFRDFQESPLPVLTEEARWKYYREHGRGDPLGKKLDSLIPAGSLVYGVGFPHRIRSISPVIETVIDEHGNRLRSNRDPVMTPFVESGKTKEDLLRILHDARVDYLVVPVEKGSTFGFWDLAESVCEEVRGTHRRLLKVPETG